MVAAQVSDYVQDKLVVFSPSRVDLVDLWYARIIAVTCAAIKDCCYVEIGVDLEAMSMRVVAPYARESHGCDLVAECDVPRGSNLWVMSSEQFLQVYEGSDPHVVFIDADHTYEAVSADFHGVVSRWPNTTVFLHDTWPPMPGIPECGDVGRLREELEQSENYETFTWRQDPGLTIVRKR